MKYYIRNQGWKTNHLRGDSSTTFTVILDFQAIFIKSLQRNT